MNILGIIPARDGSKRLKRKNLRLLGGKPLVSHTIDAAIGSTKLNKIIVNTDSQDVLDLDKDYKSERVIFLKRPPEISGDKSPAIDYVTHSLEYMSKSGEQFDAVVILQPSSPLSLSEDIDKTIELLIESKSDTAVSVVKLAHHLNPLKLKVLEGDKLLPYIEEENDRMTENELPDVYIRNCSVYASRISVIKEGRIIGNDCRGYVMPRDRSIDINDEFDLEFAEFLYLRNNRSTD